MRRLLTASAAAVGLLSIVVSCGTDRAIAPKFKRAGSIASALSSIRVSEIHYDNTLTDVGERIEISGPAGASLSGWTLVLYNGNTATAAVTYNTIALTGNFPTTCGSRGVIVISFPTDGIQNGPRDGWALVNSGVVSELRSYEGVFTASNGPAAGMTSTDIGVSQAGSEPQNSSLHLEADGTWKVTTPLGTNTFGACNDNDSVVPPTVARVVVSPDSASIFTGASQNFTATATDSTGTVISGATFTWQSDAPAVATVSATGVATAVGPGDAHIIATSGTAKDTGNLHVDPAPPPPTGVVRFSEIHYDNNGSDVGEAIEIEGPWGTNLAGWKVLFYNGDPASTTTPLKVYNTFNLTGTIPPNCGSRGVLSFSPGQIQNGDPDGFALVDNTGHVVEFFSYGGQFTAADGAAAGMASTPMPVKESSSTPIGKSLQRDDIGWFGPAPSSFGGCNAPIPAGFISISGRDASADPPLPVGFEDQLFGNHDDLRGHVTSLDIVWSSETPTIASIDARGVIHGLAAGSAKFKAATPDGASSTITLPVDNPLPSSSASWGGNTEFGVPIGGNDYIVVHDQYTASYNASRNIPNWVAARMEASHFGTTTDRCDCFTFDPLLPSPPLAHYNTADYTGAGAAAGYGIDRGHLLRSFDVTVSAGDNKFSYLLSNIVPQSHDLNTGVWADEEVFLGSIARGTPAKDVWIIAGASGSKGTVKNEGLITIPAYVWKVAVIMPHGSHLSDVHSASDIEVIATIFPNEPSSGLPFSDWTQYKTTVDAVEALSGYNVLDLLPDQIEIAVESNTKPPVADAGGPYASSEGSSVTLSGSASTDPDVGDILTYAWDFGDGSTGVGVNPAHTYANDGDYSVTLTVTDSRGLISTATTNVVVSNVAPSISFVGATILPHETYSVGGSFTDPGADSWTATVDYGDGSQPLALAGKTFALSHIYDTPGTYTVTVIVNDDDTSGAQTATVVVKTFVQAAQDIAPLLNGNNSLNVKLNAAIQQLGNGNTTAAVNQLNALLNEIEALVRSRRMESADANAIRAAINRLITSINH